MVEITSSIIAAGANSSCPREAFTFEDRIPSPAANTWSEMVTAVFWHARSLTAVFWHARSLETKRSLVPTGRMVSDLKLSTTVAELAGAKSLKTNAAPLSTSTVSAGATFIFLCLNS